MRSPGEPSVEVQLLVNRSELGRRHLRREARALGATLSLKHVAAGVASAPAARTLALGAFLLVAGLPRTARIVSRAGMAIRLAGIAWALVTFARTLRGRPVHPAAPASLP